MKCGRTARGIAAGKVVERNIGKGGGWVPSIFNVTGTKMKQWGVFLPHRNVVWYNKFGENIAQIGAHIAHTLFFFSYCTHACCIKP